jgi:hypothetical protein
MLATCHSVYNSEQHQNLPRLIRSAKLASWC